MTRRDWKIALGTTLATSGVLLWPLLAGEVVVGRDHARLYHPFKSWMVEQIWQGRWPAWFPYEALGVSTVPATVTALFHPFTYLAVLFGPLAGQTLLTFGAFLLAGVGMYGAVRALGGGPAGAAFAAVAMVGGGPFLSTLDNQPFLLGASMIPTFLWGLARLQDPATVRGGVVLVALAVALAILGGDVQAAYLMGLFGGLLTFLWGGRKGPRRLLPLAAAGLLGLLLAGAQVVPTVLAAPHLERMDGIRWPVASLYSIHPLRLPEIALGDILAYLPAERPDSPDTLVRTPPRGLWTLCLYSGALLPPLAILSALRGAEPRAARVGRGLCLAALLAAGIALGKFLPLYRVLYDLLPLWDIFRYPAKLTPWLQAFLASAAGIGLSRVLSGRARGLVVCGVWTGILAMSALALGLWPAEGGAKAFWLSRAGISAWIAAGVVGTFVVASGLLSRSSPRRWLPALASLLLLADVALTNRRIPALLTGPPEALDGPSVMAEAIAEAGEWGRVVSYAATTLAQDPPNGMHLEDWGYSGQAVWQRHRLAPDYPALYGLESFQPYLPGYQRRLGTLLANIGRVRAVGAAFGVRYYVSDLGSFQARPWKDDVLTVAKPLNLALTAAPVLPRAYLARPSFLNPTSDDLSLLWQALRSPLVQGGEVAVVEGAAESIRGFMESKSNPAGESRMPLGEVLRLEWADDRLEIHVRTEGPALLVVADAFAPGWTASVAERPTPILRVNGLVRGVWLPEPGTWAIQMVYAGPPGQWTGLGLSLLGLVAVAGLWRRHGARGCRARTNDLAP